MPSPSVSPVASSPVHTSKMSQVPSPSESGRGVTTQPRIGSQLTAWHGVVMQTISMSVDTQPTPSTQLSAVQTLSSSQVTGSVVGAHVAGSQSISVLHSSPAAHGVFVQPSTPMHVSVVQLLLSSHSAWEMQQPGIGAEKQPPSGLQPLA
jgi:hypothetical protein